MGKFLTTFCKIKHIRWSVVGEEGSLYTGRPDQWISKWDQYYRQVPETLDKMQSPRVCF